VLLAADSNDVVVVAGLPGAGKTTLAAAEPRALDSDAVREAWAPRLAPLPYRIWRPVVHARHWVAIWRALGQSDGVVVVRPFTSTWARRSVLRRALRHHAAVHLVVVEATPAQARERQRARGRAISARAMRRHERRWASADLAAEPWTTTTRVGGARSRRELLQQLDHPFRAGESRHLGLEVARRSPVARVAEHPPHGVPDGARGAVAGPDRHADAEVGGALRAVGLVRGDRHNNHWHPFAQRLLDAVEAAVGDERVAIRE
jgi:predicted kinase